jgi:hypothetical protein
MPTALPLRAALKRGALIAAANWPVVVVDFVIEALYKLALAVPIVGGGLMVAVLMGDDVRSFFAESLRSGADLVLSALGSAPIALAAYLAAVALVAAGGGLVMFIVKTGTLTILVDAERGAGDVEHEPLQLSSLRRLGRFGIARVIEAARVFGRRAAWLAGWLGVTYAVIIATYILAITNAYSFTAPLNWTPAWPLLVLFATSVCVVSITAVNVAYDLLRVIIVTDDCGVVAAMRRLRSFMIEDARQVLGIFGVVGSLLLLAMAASLLVTAGLTFVAWVPIASLIVLPLQFAAWLVRGLVFQFVGLTALSAYQTQYRRFSLPGLQPVAAASRVRPA